MMSTERLVRLLVNVIFASTGIALLWWASDWRIAVGAYLLVCFAREPKE